MTADHSPSMHLATHAEVMRNAYVVKVAKAAEKATLAREALDDAIYEARAAGLPLRTIAKAAGLSPEWIRQIAAL